MANKRILQLVLKKKWFDMIASGEKKEEYREIKQHYISRICKKEFNDHFEIKHFDIVCFHRGYSKKTIDVEIKDITIGTGKTEWGAKKGHKYFVIQLGRVIAMDKIQCVGKL